MAGLRSGDRTAVVNGQEWVLGGDVIVAINGVQIQGVEDAQALLADKIAGDNVRFTVIRNNATVDFNVTIGER